MDLKKDLKNKTALVTGAGRGIGRAISIALAKEGVRLALVARTVSELEETQKLIQAFHATSFIFPADIGSLRAVKTLFGKVSLVFEGLDFLINNAGYAQMRTIEETDEEVWEKSLNINLTSVYRMTRFALPLLRKRKGGAVINISSLAGTAGYEKFPGLGAYSAAKAGVVTFTEVLAKELEKDRIQAFTVSPGGVDTRMFHELAPHLKADLKPEDIAGKVLSLLRGELRLKNGANLVVEG